MGKEPQKIGIYVDGVLIGTARDASITSYDKLSKRELWAEWKQAIDAENYAEAKEIAHVLRNREYDCPGN